MFYSSRMPGGAKFWVTIQTFGACALTVCLSGTLQAWLGLPPGIVTLLVFIFFFELTHRAGFRPAATAWMAFGCSLIGCSSALPPAPDGSLTPLQITLDTLGFLLFLRFFSEGPEPDGWPVKDSEKR